MKRIEPRTMSLGLRIYATLGIVFITLCLALVVAMVIDAGMQANDARDVLSSVDSGND